MKLTRKKAIELCIELWTWLAKTGQYKPEWPEWERYGKIEACCWFCEYDKQRHAMNKTKTGVCSCCHLEKGFNGCLRETCYSEWFAAETPRTRKKYAKLFLGQIKELK